VANPLDPFGIMGRFGGGGPQQPDALTPEQQTSLLGQLGQGALSGLGYVASTLNKTFGGRAIRGALGGHYRELLSPLPFSDTLGITNPADELRGEDLLTKWGMIAPNDPHSWELRDFAGPLFDVATDPATYLTLGAGALTEAGLAAKAAGTLEPTLAGRIAAGQGGLFGLGAPLAHPAAVFGTGETGEALANLLGKGWDKALYSAPGRYLSQLFDPSVTLQGATFASEAGQRAARAGNLALQGTVNATRQHFLDVASGLEKAGVLDAPEQLRGVLEGTISPVPYTPQGQALIQAAGEVQTNLRSRLLEAQGLGRNVGELQDPSVAYAPRFRTPLAEETRGYGGYGRQMYPTTQASQLGRLDPLRNFERGTLGVNQLFTDPRLGPASANVAAGNLAANADIVLREYLPWETMGGDAELARLEGLGEAGRKAAPGAQEKYAQMLGLQEQAPRTAALAAAADPQYVAKGLNYFANHPLADFLAYGTEADRANTAVRSMYEALAQEAGPFRAGTLTKPGLEVPVASLAREAGLDPTEFSRNLTERLQALGKMPQGPGGSLADFHVGEGLARDLSRYQQAMTTPETMRPLVQAWDSITNLTKAGQTSLWPAFHTRNALTGLFMNWVIGARDPAYSALDPRAWTQPFVDAMSLRAGQPIEGLAEAAYKGMGLSDAEATRKLAEEMFATGTRTHGRTALVSDVVGRGPHTLPSGEAGPVGTITLPGRGPEKSILESAADVFRGPQAAEGTTWNPLKMRGVGGVNVDQFWLGKAGREIGAATDDMNRVSAYVAMRKQGFTPMEASLQSAAAHYDYTKMTPFEREVMRRVAPFYGWMRKNVPFTLGQIAQAPGGPMAMAVKAAAAGRQQAGFVPEYIGEGLAIPAGQGLPGDQGQETTRYLSHFGLPFEDAFQLLHGGPDALQRTLQQLIGESNPLIKMPIEMAAGKQMYSGRDLQDLYGPTGTPELDQLIMNSPLARAYTTGRTLLDPRKELLAKALNVVGPGKVTDVDVAKQRAVALRNLLEQNLQANPAVRHFQRLYVPPEQLGSLTPDELQLLQVYKTLEQAKATPGPATLNIPVR
jgi:hypothetical protein